MKGQGDMTIARMIRRRRGFTLIEILVVVVILATLASAVVWSLRETPDQARIARAKSDVATLESALETFRLAMSRYPTDEEGLQALVTAPDSEDARKWKGPYLKRITRDPWDNPYVYEIPGSRNTDGFDVLSYGADGRAGGEGVNADIGNWVEEELQ